MKKLFLSVILFLSSFLIQAQDFVVKIHKVEVMKFDVSLNNYTLYKTFKPDNLQLLKHGNMFAVNNEDESNYRLDEKLKSNDPNCINYVGTDKDNETIGIQFCLDEMKESGSMTVLYLKKVVVIYYLKP